MHEVGHNLGMGHSGEAGGWEYGDETCIMGEGFSEDGPLQCYNAAKSWQMGWFASRHHTYNIADGVWSGRLIGQVDYAGNDKTSKVILKLNTPGSDDYFVMFNRVKTGTIESKDLVMITMAGGEGIEPSQSNVVAKLGSGESTILPNFYFFSTYCATSGSSGSCRGWNLPPCPIDKVALITFITANTESAAKRPRTTTMIYIFISCLFFSFCDWAI